MLRPKEKFEEIRYGGVKGYHLQFSLTNPRAKVFYLYSANSYIERESPSKRVLARKS